MTMTAPATDLEFRAAFPDEVARAIHLGAGQTWNFPESRFFVAVVLGPPERLVGVVRYSHIPAPTSGAGVIDFRLLAGPGGELESNEAEFLAAFVQFSRSLPSSLLRYADLLAENHPLGDLLEHAGFEIRYREQYLEAPWSIAAERVARITRDLASPNSRWSSLEIRPARNCGVESALPLILARQLMPEHELRSIWNSPDPLRMDREASACLVLEGQTIGVVICADAGDHLRVMAITGHENFPGSKRRVVPLLMDHVFRTRADRGYDRIVFRANIDQARQTVNLARRTGGRVTGEARRWAKPPSIR